MCSVSGMIPFGQAEVHVGYDRNEAKLRCCRAVAGLRATTAVSSRSRRPLQYNVSKRTAMYTTGSLLKNKDDTTHHACPALPA